MGEPCNTKEQQKAQDELPSRYLSATYTSVGNEQTGNSFSQQTKMHSSKDLGAALCAYYNRVPDAATMVQTIKLHRPASMQPDKKNEHFYDR
jgi:hypothetical protein